MVRYFVWRLGDPAVHLKIDLKHETTAPRKHGWLGHARIFEICSPRVEERIVTATGETGSKPGPD